MPIENVADISTRTLLRMIMSHLWRWYDFGGVSVGRSIRASLLESITRLMDSVRDEKDFSIEETDIWTLVNEAKRRILQKKQMRFERPLFSKLSDVSLWYYIHIVLYQMILWYREDTKKKGPIDSLFAEQEIVTIMWKLISGPTVIKFFKKYRTAKWEEVVQESKDRFAAMHYYETRLEIWKFK